MRKRPITQGAKPVWMAVLSVPAALRVFSSISSNSRGENSERCWLPLKICQFGPFHINFDKLRWRQVFLVEKDVKRNGLDDFALRPVLSPLIKVGSGIGDFCGQVQSGFAGRVRGSQIDCSNIAEIIQTNIFL